MIVAPFKREHLDILELQQAQAWIRPMFNTKEYRDAIEGSGPCFTGFHDGEVLGCAGIVHVWEGRAYAWALMSAIAGRHFISVFRAISRFLELQSIKRIEAVVQSDFEQGHRMIKMLGFSFEGELKAYLPNGADCAIYGRVS